MESVIDVGTGTSKTALGLSNFNENRFTIDGVECASMEGFLQSLKFEDIDKQESVCTLIGVDAKRQGQKRNKHWKNGQTLWWQGQGYKRVSAEYQELLDRAFNELNKNEEFNTLLKESVGKFTHKIGKFLKRDTVLTAHEFCSRLTTPKGGRGYKDA